MPTIEKHSPGSFCWIELATSDQEAAKTFYSALFGWNSTDNPMGPDAHYTMFDLGGAKVGGAYTLLPDQRANGVPPNWMLYVNTENADQTATRVSELGGKVLAPAFDVFEFGRMAILQDPTGAVFAIWQPKQHPGMGISGDANTFSWADLSTNDVETAKGFYEGLFKWKIEAGEKDPSGYLHITNGDRMIGGVPPSKYRDPNTPPFWMIYFAVTDCDATTAKAKDLGGAVYMPPSTMADTLRIAILADPQGAVFALFQDLAGH